MNNISFAREAWKEINLGEGFTNTIRIEVSDFGRVRSYNKINNGKLMKGSMINGYSIIRVRLFRPRDSQTTEKLQLLQAALAEQSKKIKSLQKTIADTAVFASERKQLQEQLDAELLSQKKNKTAYTTAFNRDVKKRTFYYAGLIHRLVAEYFLPAPAEGKTIVTHLDHDKLNNQVANLKWISEEEKNTHQKLSPLVIADKAKRKYTAFDYPERYKLSVTKVMFLKKLLNEGKPISNLAKQFKITESQVVKIKKEESWGLVEAAK